MNNSIKLNVFWFRRDLRLKDNTGLYYALNSSNPVLLVFIYDENILDDLEDKYDSRIKFIHNELISLNNELINLGSGILVKYGKPLNVFRSILNDYNIESVFCNEDYEPYALSRDRAVKRFLNDKDITLKKFKDHVIFHKDEIVKNNNEPYKVFSAYKTKWNSKLNFSKVIAYDSENHLNKLFKPLKGILPGFNDIGFRNKKISFPPKTFNLDTISNYDKTRDFPYLDGTSRLGIHFRYGTISIRRAVKIAQNYNPTWLNELIWREFYSMILYHYPEVVTHSFKRKYDDIEWLNNEDDFERWCEGRTGYPIVDAGMRQLNESGYMHNRVRMITASFLTKHLLIDWRWGETYFAKKLLDYDLASNNGGWQWSAGTGTDAQPYFRVFNPYEQTRKFDPDHLYIKKWLPEYSPESYKKPIIDHKFARLRAIETYKRALR